MNNKYKALFKYEFKKLIGFYFALILFFILYMTMRSNFIETEVHKLLSSSDYFNIYFRILQPNLFFMYGIFVLVLVYIQFNDGFNKLWHSLPFTNKDVIMVKLITGVFTILAFVTVVGIGMFVEYFKYAIIYKDTLQVLNIDPSIINTGFIIITLLSVFAVYMFIYFFTVLVQYYIGNCISGICLAVLLLHLPILVISGFDIFYHIPEQLTFIINPHYFSSDNNRCDYSGLGASDNLNIFINTGLFNQYSLPAIIYYVILSGIFIVLVLKVATSPKWIEQNSPFSKRLSPIIFKLAFTIDFVMIGIAMVYDSILSKAILGIVLGIIGYVVSRIIIKRQGVSL